MFLAVLPLRLLLSQPPAYTFEFYNLSHGLPSSEIHALGKDKQGYLWVGTAAGLSKYDGYQFQNFFYAENGETIGFVKKIKTDKQGRMWIGSGAGLFLYADDKIIKLANANNTPQAVNDICTMQDGSLWLATGAGPVFISADKINVTPPQKIILEDYLKPSNSIYNSTDGGFTIYHIAVAADGTVFMAQNKTIYKLANDKLEVIYQHKLPNDKILSLFPSSYSKLYFDCEATEMHKWEEGKEVIRLFNHKLKQPVSIVSANSFWYVGTSGLYYFHPDEGVASQLINTMDKDVLIPYAFLQDGDFFWVASADGLVKVKPSPFTAYNVLPLIPHKDFYSFLQLKDGHFLAGSNRGILLEQKSDGFSVYKRNIVPKAEVKALYEDKNGWLWVGSGYQGIALLKKGKVENYTMGDGLHSLAIYSFFNSSDGSLYAMGDNGLTKIETADGGKLGFTPYYYKPHISLSASFYAAVEAPDKSIWLAGQEGLVYLKNDSLQNFKLDGKAMPANYIIKDKAGFIWITTNMDGILKCRFSAHSELEVVQRFTDENGLNTLNYATLLADNENNIWAGSSRGVSVIGQQGKLKDRVLNFDISDGFLPAGYSYIRLYQQNDSIIWAATTNGIASVNKNKLFINNKAFPVYISVKEIMQGNGNDKEFVFAHNNNSFVFQYTALDYEHPDGIQYFYQLKGKDTGWINAGKLRTASYDNLPPGRYTFFVKAVNSKGQWSMADAGWSFVIQKPFWKKWWFRVLAGLVIFAFLYVYLRRREKTIQEKESAKTTMLQLKAEQYRHQLETEQITGFFTSTIHQHDNTDDMLWDVARNLIGKLGFEDCMIYLWNEGKTILQQKAGYGLKGSMQGEENKESYNIPKGKGIISAAVEGKQYLLVNDTSKDSRYFTADDKIRLSELCVPIMRNEEVIGAINTEHSEKNFYTERHVQVLITIASLLAEKIEKIEVQRITREKELEVLQLSKDLATSQLTALRSQMNPHFIFNALNSVQQYILQGNITEANRYLSKFSKLQRQVLNQSDQNFIPLDKELEVLHLYLELEQLRFENGFTYNIDVNTNVDADEIKIPPMIVQPFVENSIWHGLMPKQDNRSLKINFEMTSDEMLVCTVTDNGIGREAAVRLKNMNGGKHQSKGLSLVYDRLNILSQQYGQAFKAEIKDLMNAEGLPSGTEVKLFIYTG